MQWDFASADLDKEADALITKTRAVYDAVGGVKADDVTYDNIIKVRSMSVIQVHHANENARLQIIK